jgi:glycosyltransferase involved in cell wall biosynthesis
VRLSVIVPNFNHAALLPRCLTALLRQETSASEIIVVDDASVDDSVNVVEKFQQQHGSIRLIRHPANRGVPTASNTGLAAASGDLVYFAAADDFVLPGLFSAASGALRAHAAAAFFCSWVVIVDRNSQIIGFRPFFSPWKEDRYVSAETVIRESAVSDNWAVGQSVIYRRDLLVELGDFDASLGSFADGMRVRQLAFRHGFFFSTKVLAAWEVYPESYSARSALSRVENVRLIEAAKRRMAATLPSEVNERYPALFERRLRFNMARLSLVWRRGRPDLEGIAMVAGFGRIERIISRAFSVLPGISSLAILFLLYIRLRPFGMAAIVRSWWFLRARLPALRSTTEWQIAQSIKP